mgnify:CR=1 FL=1
MAVCECLSTCPFFNDMIPDLPVVAEGMKSLYCQGSNAECARYMVFKALGSGKSPLNLFPNETERARWIIQHGGADDEE